MSTYLAAGQLVLDQGVFSTTPGELKQLAATSPLTIVDSGGVLTIGGAGNPITWGTTLNGTTIALSWQTSKLIFGTGLTAVPDTTNDQTIITNPNLALHAGLTGAAAETSVLHFEPTEFDYAIANTIALVSLKQSWIDSIKQQVLDSITSTNSSITLDRSTAGALAMTWVDPPLFAWPANQVLYWDGSQSTAQYINTGVTNQTGSRMTITNFPTSKFRVSFELKFYASQVSQNNHLFGVFKLTGSRIFSINRYTTTAWLDTSTASTSFANPYSIGTFCSVEIEHDNTNLTLSVGGVQIASIAASTLDWTGFQGDTVFASEWGGGGSDSVCEIRNMTIISI
jgi:hypothetical protein